MYIWLLNSSVKFHAKISTHCWNINKSRREDTFLCSPCIISYFFCVQFLPKLHQMWLWTSITVMLSSQLTGLFRYFYCVDYCITTRLFIAVLLLRLVLFVHVACDVTIKASDLLFRGHHLYLFCFHITILGKLFTHVYLWHQTMGDFNFR